jgi:16S rRNA (cytidine1402-2'-O)-methyltransferase
MNGILSIVATPIGNLGDITLRALEALKKADVIFCEDTRVTSKLLARYEISKPLVRSDAKKEALSAQKMLSMLEEGKHVALVTDAGTPGISDPGSRLVSLIRANDRIVKIEALPGPSALTAALSIAGLDTSTFIFLGFLPHKKGRQTLFKEIAAEKRTAVFYESPHRILKTLASLVEVLSSKRHVAVCRELTKLYESVIRGTAGEVQTHFAQNPGEVRGEFVVIVAP